MTVSKTGVSRFDSRMVPSPINVASGLRRMPVISTVSISDGHEMSLYILISGSKSGNRTSFIRIPVKVVSPDKSLITFNVYSLVEPDSDVHVIIILLLP